jgi:hypothetical protein
MGTFLKFFVVVALAVVLTLTAIYFYHESKPEPPVVVTDSLCEFVKREQHMGCVAVIAGDTYMKPGAIVEVLSGGPGLVSLPVADLMTDQCRVPGADLATLKSGMLKQNPITVPQLSYEVNHALQIGADIEVPQLDNFTFKAGPKWSNVSKIDLAIDESWVTQMDELAAVDAYGSCQIKKRCTDYIKSRGYRVVGSAVTARGLSYRLYNKKGELISLEAGAKSGEFFANVGGSTDLGATTDSTIKAKDARVYGVRLMPAAVFESQQSCEQTVVFEPPSAQAIVTISGGGGKGSIGDVQTVEKPIGQTASLSATGTEDSECSPDFERKRSGAQASATVMEQGPGALRFDYNVRAEGGHYATAATCPADLPVGKTGHDTTATASAELRATIFVLLRADDPPPLTVSYSDMPADTRIEMFDYQSRKLQVAIRRTVNGDQVTTYEDPPAVVSGGGRTTVATRGPGLYRIEASFRLNASVTGNADDTKQKSASLRVSLNP